MEPTVYVALIPSRALELSEMLDACAVRCDRLDSEAAMLASAGDLPTRSRHLSSCAERHLAVAHVLRDRVNTAVTYRLAVDPRCPPLPSPDLTWTVCDPRGDGRAVVELGAPLSQARHIAVLVPGVGTELGSLGDEIDRAHRLAAAAGPETAVVLWADYDAPDWLHAGSQDAARDAAGVLATYLDSLPRSARVTIVGHSYGSLVVSHALRTGGRAHATVILGSPGVGVDEAGDLRDGGQVYVLKARGDLVASLGAFGGVDPASPNFGALRLTTGGANGHSDYLDLGTESLANVAAVVTGNLADVGVHRPTLPDHIAEQLGYGVDAFDDAATAARHWLDLPDWADGALAGLQRVTNGGGQLASRAIANGTEDLRDLWDDAVGAIGWG